MELNSKKMKKLILFIGSYLLIILVAGSIGCQEEAEGVLFEPSTVSFDPSITNFTGLPGDTLNLKVIVDGESDFKNLKKMKFSNGKIVNETFILETQVQPYTVPYIYLFEYVLQENEIGKKITFSFRVESEIGDPPRGRMTTMSMQDLIITTIVR